MGFKEYLTESNKRLNESVWSKELTDEIDKLDKEYIKTLTKAKIDRYSKEASDFWHKNFRDKQKKIFDKYVNKRLNEEQIQIKK